MNQLDKLQLQLQYTFKTPLLLVTAVTHRSFGSDHYERLEFLGDSVLNLAISELLFDKLGSLPEGDLSRVRANLVKQDTLHMLAVKVGIPDCLRLGEGEKRSGGKNRPSILADALEAIIGAVHLDAGYNVARELVQRLFSNYKIEPTMQAIGKDPKTELQEWLQGNKYALPTYTVIAVMGQAHQQNFDVQCDVPELKLSERGIGGTRRIAEQIAAKAILEEIKMKALE